MIKDNSSIDREVVKTILAINTLGHTIGEVAEYISGFSKTVLSVELPEAAATYKGALQEAGEVMVAAMKHYRMVVSALGQALLEMPEEQREAAPPVVLPVRH